MKEIVHRPDPSALIGSLRAIGYSFDTALADIVDNSIAAAADSIDIFFSAMPEPILAVLDNGCGMGPERLKEAMRHGGYGPTVQRNLQDLGRYGLGLKTASLSQCRQLTVLSKNGSSLSGARWDLDRVEAEHEWVLEILSQQDIAAVPWSEKLDALANGTLVIWSHFDRGVAGEASPRSALEKLVDKSRGHLSLVFHRYLSGEDHTEPIRIAINDLPLEPKDPFMTGNRRTERLPQETVVVDGATIVIQPYILPHLSYITESEMATAGGADGLRRHQGFYIYRNRRLIKEGTWFRMIPLSELNKLARVRIDIPNSLDHVWNLDVKKSSADPPEQVRTVLRRIIERIANRSQNVFRDRKRRTPGTVIHLWERSKIRQGVVYSINRDHPCIATIRESLDDVGQSELERSLRMLELYLPADAIYHDMASDRPIDRPVEDVETQLREQAEKWLEAVGPEKVSRDQ